MPASSGPAEPALRPQLPASACLLVVCILAERWVLGHEGASHAWQGPVSLSLVIASILAMAEGTGRGRGAACLCLALFLVALLACARSCLLVRSMDECELELGRVSGSGCVLDIETDSVQRRGSHTCRARVTLPSGRACGVWLRSPQRLFMGERLRCSTRWAALPPDDFGKASRMRGIVGSLRVMGVTSRGWQAGGMGRLRAWRARQLRHLAAERSDSAAWIAGVALGCPALARERGMDERLSRCGLSHLMAVSGSHLAIVSSVVGALLLRLGAKPLPRLLCALSTGFALVLLCGAPPSATRALLMACAAFGSEVSGRRRHAVSSLCLVGLMLALFDPALSGSLGFQLSLASVAGLCLFSWPVARLFHLALSSAAMRLPSSRRAPRRLRRIASSTLDLASASMVAQFSTLPLTCAYFGTFSLVSPLTNLLGAPPFALGLVLGLPGLLVSGTLPWSDLPLSASKTCFELLSVLVERISALPLAAVSLPNEPWLPPLLWAGEIALALLWLQPAAARGGPPPRHVS